MQDQDQRQGEDETTEEWTGPARRGYWNIDAAIESEIIEPIEQDGTVTDARAAFNIERIAYEVLTYNEENQLYFCHVDTETFWETVRDNATPEG